MLDTFNLSAWVSDYAQWYQHFLAMQPVNDRLAEQWAHQMTENTLVQFHLRTDKAQIVQLAMEQINKRPLQNNHAPFAGPEPRTQPASPIKKPLASGQVCLF